MAQSAWDIGERPLESLDSVDADPSWLKLLPSGTEIKSTEPSGAASFWSRTARIHTRLPTGEPRSYFFKLTNGERGRLMAEGEYESMAALHSVAPQITPEPIGWGSLTNNPNGHFFICQYVDLADEIPDPQSIGKKLADMHRKSISVSPSGMYGFPVTTCNGTFPQDNTWNPSWEAFFAQQMRGALKAEQEVHGACAEYERLLPPLFEKVIPRLLRPLETGGNSIKPALLHGDLWDGNVSFHAESNDIFVYDASSFWGHNEYDLHNWRAARFKLRKSFIKEYFNHFPISAPEADWEDRNLLYSIRADLHDSYLFPSTKRFRSFVIAAIEELVQKFPDGCQGEHQCRGYESSLPKEEHSDANGTARENGPDTNVVAQTLENESNVADNDRQATPDREHWGMKGVQKATGLTRTAVEPPRSEIKFGESAISPFGGSEAGVHLS